MYKLQRAILAGGGALAIALGGSYAFAADNAGTTPPASTSTDVNTEPNSNGKTSDRTPGNPAPDRTPNAGTAGATGTDAGQTHEGTSDRTPEHKTK
ncbi:hypothetical protein [Hyphomicrobium methylovorum]|uniref:hypothetical protein n=1 Tax=Hyphomicrobium methylovorum TaxID=84 RepID=UPI0015E712E4|nr:hypothetical protein [Hyphomicrobium methylovorum]